MSTRTFDARQTGTPESAWLGSPLLSTPELRTPGRGDGVVVLAAHPDDESLGAGGLVAMAAARGAAVRVVIATDGAASHPRSPTHDAARLAALRRAEARVAVEVLAHGVEPVLLGLPDGALAEHRDALADLLERHLDGVTHVVTTWAGDRHPDHEVCAAVAAGLAAARPGVACWQFPVWAWHWADPEGDDVSWQRVGRVPLSDDARAAKRAALRAYRSQHSPLSPEPGDEALLSPHVLRHFDREFETFVVTAPAAEPAYFDALYEADPDPWGLVDRFYEQRKRELVLACLPRRTFRRAFEPGCAVGALTAGLAARCAEVVAWDAAAAAVERARRVAPHVVVEHGRIPDRWPDGTFDLIVLSEVGYYCTDLALLVGLVCSALAEDGVVVACHWRHPAPDHPVTAEAVHDALAAGLRGRADRLVLHEEADLLLDVWSADPRSVAQAEGIVA